MKDYKCIYCGREIKNAGSLAVHQKECMFNPDRVIIPRKSNWNKRKKPWNAGHKYQDLMGIENAKKYKEKISQGLKNSNLVTGYGSTPQKQQQRRNNISKAMKGNPKAGGYHGGGKGKKSFYQSKNNGLVFMASSYELRYAKWLDENNIRWKRNLIKFPYKWQDGSLHYYTPDFYLDDTNQYIQIKGWIRQHDKQKWSQFPFKLTVLLSNDLKQMKIL